MTPAATAAVLLAVLETPLRAQDFGPPGSSRPVALAPAEASTAGGAGGGGAAEDAKAQQAKLAMAIQNPIANLISVPIQNNWDFGIGPEDAMQYKVNIQPVIPFALSEDWNLITRTILPVIYQEPRFAGDGYHSGLGDIVQSFFFSPKVKLGGWIVGGGPALLYPSATDTVLGADRWAAGPTIVALKQEKGLTYGLLANHLWDYAGWEDATVNATFLQPFVSYTTKTFTAFAVNTETTYDWDGDQWIVPVNFMVQQMLKAGKQPLALQLGYRYYAEGPSGGPEWGLRLQLSLLFPK
jgi:hypothetical protein